MRIPPRAVAPVVLALLATACSAGGGPIGQGMASIVVPVPASISPVVSPTPVSGQRSMAETPVGGVYVGRAKLARTNLAGVSHRSQSIHWVVRPRCLSASCPVQLISKSGGFSMLLRRGGAAYRGSTRRPPGFFTCAGKPERVTLRVVLLPVAGAVVGSGWIATQITATLQNVSVPSPKCRRSYLNTTVVANRT